MNVCAWFRALTEGPRELVLEARQLHREIRDLAALLRLAVSAQQQKQPARVWVMLIGIGSKLVPVDAFEQADTVWVKPGETHTFRFQNYVGVRRIRTIVSNAEIGAVRLGGRVIYGNGGETEGAPFVFAFPDEPWLPGIDMFVQVSLPSWVPQ